MYQLLPLVVSILILIALLVFKVNLGWSLVIASGSLLVFSGNGLVEFVEIVRRTATDGQFLEIIGIVLLINLLEELLRRAAYFDRTLQVLQETFKNRVKITAVFPALFGAIPAIGGAKLSAPLVELAAKGLKITRAEQALLNYWFRHTWEFCSPLFPGPILAIYLSGIETGKYILLMLPCTIIFVVLGHLFFLRPVLKRNQEAGQTDVISVQPQSQQEPGVGFWKASFRLIKIVWPVLAIMFIVVVFKRSILWPLLLTNLILLYRTPKGKGFVHGLTKKVFSFQLLWMVIGVFLFKTTFEWTGIPQVIPSLLAGAGIPSYVLIIVFPLMIGLLTGLPSAVVGITYPILVPVFNHGGMLHLGALMLAFVAGHVGSMLSPLHVCFVLTVDYFRTEILPFWKRLFYPQALELIVIFVLAYILGIPG